MPVNIVNQSDGSLDRVAGNATDKVGALMLNNSIL